MRFYTNTCRRCLWPRPNAYFYKKCVLPKPQARFGKGLLQPSKHWFGLSQMHAFFKTYRFTSAKHTPRRCCCSCRTAIDPPKHEGLLTLRFSVLSFAFFLYHSNASSERGKFWFHDCLSGPKSSLACVWCMFLRLDANFGVPLLVSFWSPFGRPWSPFGRPWSPFGRLWSPFGL